MRPAIIGVVGKDAPVALAVQGKDLHNTVIQAVPVSLPAPRLFVKAALRRHLRVGAQRVAGNDIGV